jgi:hypothetical protein
VTSIIVIITYNVNILKAVLMNIQNMLARFSRPRGLSYLQARTLDNQMIDAAANKFGNRLASNVYTKPLLASSLAGGIASKFLNPATEAAIFGSKGALVGAANYINPAAANMAMNTMPALGAAGGGFLKGMAVGAMPIKAAVSLPGYAIANGLTALGAKAGVGTALGGALTGIGTTIGGGMLAPVIGTAASLYALKKGGQWASRRLAMRGALQRQNLLRRGYAASSSGYNPELIRNLGLRLVKQ